MDRLEVAMFASVVVLVWALAVAAAAVARAADRQFRLVADSGLPATGLTFGGTWADLDGDGDGDWDLVVTNGEESDQRTAGAMQVCGNLADTPDLTVELQAWPGAAPHGLGALVSLGPGEGLRSLRVRSVANPWNATTLPVHCGLGAGTAASELTVAWPAGGRSIVAPAPLGGACRVVEAGC